MSKLEMSCVLKGMVEPFSKVASISTLRSTIPLAKNSENGLSIINC